MKINKNIFKILAIFIISVVGGIFADQILWPYFIERPLFYKYGLERAPINIVEENTIIVQENTALTIAVEKVEKTVVAIETVTKSQEVLQGSGFVVSADGLVLTLAELVPQGSAFSLFINGSQTSFEIEKRDLEKNLALIRVEEKNLPTAGFFDIAQLKIGERVFLVGTVFSKNAMQRMVNQGIVKFFEPGLVRTNIIESSMLRGSPLFDIEGDILGISTIDSGGGVSAISISTIREFVEL